MMLPDIAPHVFRNEMSFAPPRPEDAAVFWRAGAILMDTSGGRIRLPRVGDFPPGVWRYLFRIDRTGYYLSGEEPQELPGMAFVPQRSVMDLEPVELVQACSAAGSLARWYAGTHFCGACGARMEHSRTERAMVCPACGGTVYPKICPSVIAAVTDGDRLLLTRYAGRAFRRYALVAGFTEIGETVEQTVRREVLEETGLRVKNLRYYKSQPWSFSDTLLAGFYCDLDGSDAIRIEEDELSEALWLPRGEIPPRGNDVSLTAEMMERFRLGQDGLPV